MNLKTLFIISAIPLFFVGLGLTFATRAMLEGFAGIDVNPASIHMARATGSSFIGIATMIFLARNSAPSPARNALVAGLSLFFFLAAVTDARAILAGTLPTASWFSGVGLWLLFFVLTGFVGWPTMSES